MKKTENQKIEVNLETDTVIIEYKLEYIYQTDEYLDQSKNKFEDLKNEDLKNKEQEFKRTQAKKEEAVNKIERFSIIVIRIFTNLLLIIFVLVIIKNLSLSLIIFFLLPAFIYMLAVLNTSGGSKVDKYYAQVMLYKCDKCLRNFAYKEIIEPSIREVSTPEDYKVIATKYFKCRYCGYEIIREEPYGIEAFKGDYNFFGPKTISEYCIKCRHQRILREFRKPDIQQLYSGELIKTRYYKCEYCGDIRIKREKYWPAEPYYGN